MTSHTDKTWNIKSIILIFFYLTAVAVYAVLLRDSFVPIFSKASKLDEKFSRDTITVFFVILALVTPASFLAKRNIQGFFAAAGLLSTLIVCLFDLYIIQAADEEKRSQLKFIFGYDVVSFSYVLLILYVVIVDNVIICFMNIERKELKEMDNGDQKLELESAC